MSHRPTFANHIEKSWAHSFRDNRIDGICPENTCQQLCILSMSLPHNKALPKLFPTVSSLPTELSPSNFPRLPFRSCCRRFRLTPFQQSSPRAISHGFFSVHDVVASVSLPPNEVSPSYFPRLPFRSWCRRFSLAPSQRSLPKLFPTVSFPFMMSSLPSRSLPTDLSPSYFPRFPFRSWYRRFRLAPSQRSSPQANSHGFLSVHDVVPSVSLHPRQSKLNENPSIGDTFGKKNLQTGEDRLFRSSCALAASLWQQFHFWGSHRWVAEGSKHLLQTKPSPTLLSAPLDVCHGTTRISDLAWLLDTWFLDGFVKKMMLGLGDRTNPVAKFLQNLARSYWQNKRLHSEHKLDLVATACTSQDSTQVGSQHRWNSALPQLPADMRQKWRLGWGAY